MITYNVIYDFWAQQFYSAATRVNYGKTFNDLFIANLLLSVMVKEFWRSVRIRQSYGKKSSGTFFSGHGVVVVIVILNLYYAVITAKSLR